MTLSYFVNEYDTIPYGIIQEGTVKETFRTFSPEVDSIPHFACKIVELFNGSKVSRSNKIIDYSYSFNTSTIPYFFDKYYIENKIVLIGYKSEDIESLKSVPYGVCYNTEVQAAIVATLLANKSINKFYWNSILLFIITMFYYLLIFIYSICRKKQLNPFIDSIFSIILIVIIEIFSIIFIIYFPTVNMYTSQLFVIPFVTLAVISSWAIIIFLLKKNNCFNCITSSSFWKNKLD